MSELTDQARLAMQALAAQLTALNIPFALGAQDQQGRLIAYNHTPPGTRAELFCAIHDVEVPLWKQGQKI